MAKDINNENRMCDINMDAFLTSTIIFFVKPTYTKKQHIELTKTLTKKVPKSNFNSFVERGFVENNMSGKINNGILFRKSSNPLGMFWVYSIPIT